MQSAAKQLQIEGFALVPYDHVLRGLVERAARSLEEFCALPLVEKNCYMQLGGQNGYIHKSDTAESFEISGDVRISSFDPATTPSFINDALLISEIVLEIGQSSLEAVRAVTYFTHGTTNVPKNADYIFELFTTDESSTVAGRIRIVAQADFHPSGGSGQFAVVGAVSLTRTGL